MYTSDLQLPAQCVGLLAWADAKGGPFTEQDIFDRFPVPDDQDSGLGHPLMFWIPKLSELGYLEPSTINLELKPSWIFTPPPADSGVPILFKEFCKAYPGQVGSAPFCFKRFKLHKDWKHALPKLRQALADQIVEREIMVRRQEFIAPWKNLTTWINQRCWENEIRYRRTVEDQPIPSGYMLFLHDKFGKTATPVLAPSEYEDWMSGKGDFAGIRNKVSLTRMESLLETAHREYYNNRLPQSASTPYLRLVSLYKDAIR